MTPPPRWTPDFRSEAANKLAELFPEVLADGKIDLEALKALLAEDAAEPSERFGLFWPGKARAIQAAQTPTSATLAPDRENSVDWDNTQNIFIEGDNLEVLKILQKHYYGQIKMIYIDPPYNTGKDFVYKDDYSDPLGSYLKMTGQADGEGRLSTNTESDGRFHSNWLNMMYPRLKLAKNLLREDGVIFISIDDKELINLKYICSEVFGEQNFVGLMTIQSNPRGSQSSKHLSHVHEYILMVAKNSKMLTLKGVSKSDEAISQYSEKDNDGKLYRLLGLRQRGGAWRKEDRPLMHYPIYVNPQNGAVSLHKDSEFNTEVIPQRPSGELGRWTWGKGKLSENLSLVVGKKINRSGNTGNESWDIFRKDYLQGEDGENKTAKVKTIWGEKEINYQNGKKEIESLFGNSDIFTYPKPTYIMRKLASMLSEDSNDILLDFFAGSGTTAHAVMALNAEDGGNRRCISVQLPESTDNKEYKEARKAGYQTISEITRERIRRAGQKIKNEEANKLENREEPLDTGFRAYKLADSSFTRWNLSSDISEENLQEQLQMQVDSSEGQATPESKLTELLLRLGLSHRKD